MTLLLITFATFDRSSQCPLNHVPLRLIIALSLDVAINYHRYQLPFLSVTVLSYDVDNLWYQLPFLSGTIRISKCCSQALLQRRQLLPIIVPADISSGCCRTLVTNHGNYIYYQIPVTSRHGTFQQPFPSNLPNTVA